jgi:hypothetical protein
MRVFALRPSYPSAGRVYQPATLPERCLVRLYERRDLVLNADWDRLITLILDAWCWRDPDCIAAVVDCLARLRRSVDHDWT